MKFIVNNLNDPKTQNTPNGLFSVECTTYSLNIC